MSLYPHQTVQAQHQLSSLAAVNTRLLASRWQRQRRPISVAPNFHAERSSPLTAGDLNISNYTILNTFGRICLFAGRPETLNPLSVVNSTLIQIQTKTWTHFPTSKTLKTSQTRSLNQCHPCHGRKYTPAPALRRSITPLSHRNATLRAAMRRTYKIIPTIRLWRVKSTNISTVESTTRPFRRTRTTCWRKNTPLCVSQASKTGLESRSTELACHMIWLSGSGNYTLSRIWDGMTITNTLSNTGVETSSIAWDGKCGSQPTLSIGYSPPSGALTAIHPRNPDILKCTLETGGGRHR